MFILVLMSANIFPALFVFIYCRRSAENSIYHQTLIVLVCILSTGQSLVEVVSRGINAQDPNSSASTRSRMEFLSLLPSDIHGRVGDGPESSDSPICKRGRTTSEHYRELPAQHAGIPRLI